MASVAWLAGVDSVAVLLHEPSVPRAGGVPRRRTRRASRSCARPWGGIAALLAAVALTALAPGSGGAYTALSLPATSCAPPAGAGDGGRVLRLRQEAGVGGRPDRGRRARSALALVHPTYVIFVAVPLAGYVLARLVLARGELARGAAGLALRARFRPRPCAAWLAPTRARHGVAQPVRRRARARARALPGSGRHLLAGQLPPGAGDARPARRRRDRRSHRRTTRRARLAQALVGVRARRLGGAACDSPPAAAVHTVLGRRVAVASSAGRRIRAARRRLRGWRGCARAARVVVGNPRGARGGNRARARVPGGVHVRPRRGRTGDRGLDRARGRRGRV